ncbi:MAG: hypothetical protein LC708_00025, partial [Actinobacteria bacterium]|nr:hypothetical protein [Actinomycetota bacterium]
MLGVVAASPAARSGAQVAPPPAGGGEREAGGGGNVVVQWNNVALQSVRDSKLGPPMVARALARVHTCI